MDNNVGWKYQSVADIVVTQFEFDPIAIHHFTVEAQAWLDTPIEQLGTKFFSGRWRLGAGLNYTLDLSLGPFQDTPRKTDWFTASIYLTAGGLRWNGSLHIDYTCLDGFVRGLIDEGYAS